MENKMKCHIDRSLWSSTAVTIISQKLDGDLFIAEPLVFTKHKPGTVGMPTISLPFGSEQDFLQSIVDQAWDMGIRPRYAKESRGEIESIKYHLEDMRSLVFRKGK